MVGVSPTHCSLCAEDLRKCLAHFVLNRPIVVNPYNPLDRIATRKPHGLNDEIANCYTVVFDKSERNGVEN